MYIISNLRIIQRVKVKYQKNRELVSELVFYKKKKKCSAVKKIH